MRGKCQPHGREICLWCAKNARDAEEKVWRFAQLAVLVAILAVLLAGCGGPVGPTDGHGGRSVQELRAIALRSGPVSGYNCGTCHESIMEQTDVR
jgi:hypothetical protein